jgi:hypothetical protein
LALLIACATCSGEPPDGAGGPDDIEMVRQAGTAALPVSPVLECVAEQSGALTAIYGYDNRGTSTLSVPVGSNNFFHPSPQNRGQPTSFAVGRKRGVLQVGFPANGVLVWNLASSTATASAGSMRCQPAPCPVAGGMGVQVGSQCFQFPPDPGAILGGTIIATGTDVGRTDGQLSVTADGSSVYSAPLWVPPGRNGMAPELAVVVSSGGGSGLLGVGGHLSGLSQITRCPKTAAIDGAPSAPGLVPDDALCLDGQRLVVVGGSEGLAGTEYRTVDESFSRIVVETWDALGQGPDAITVYRKDGRVMHYGRTAQSRLEGPVVEMDFDRNTTATATVPPATQTGRIAWALDRIRDRAGNTIDITYLPRTSNASEPHKSAIELLPDEIRYTGRENGPTGKRAVKFHYIDRPVEDRRERYVSGVRTVAAKVIDRISMSAPDPTAERVVRLYDFDYETSPATLRLRVKEIKECDGDPAAASPPRPVSCKRPTRLTWEDGVNGNGSFARKPTGATDARRAGFEPSWRIIPADIDNDGRDDVVYRDGETWTWRRSVPNGGGDVALGAPSPLVIERPIDSSPELDPAFVDLDGDGQLDMLAYLFDPDVDALLLGRFKGDPASPGKFDLHSVEAVSSGASGLAATAPTAKAATSPDGGAPAAGQTTRSVANTTTRGRKVTVGRPSTRLSPFAAWI